MIFGGSGTGKSTLINFIFSFFYSEYEYIAPAGSVLHDFSPLTCSLSKYDSDYATFWDTRGLLFDFKNGVSSYNESLHGNYNYDRFREHINISRCSVIIYVLHYQFTKVELNTLVEFMEFAAKYCSLRNPIVVLTHCDSSTNENELKDRIQQVKSKQFLAKVFPLDQSHTLKSLQQDKIIGELILYSLQFIKF